jgi:hypothetical protein
MRLARPLVLAALAAALVLSSAACASAAKPSATAAAAAKTPRAFFGVIADGPLLAQSTDLGAETALMKRSGVGSVRVAVYWPFMQPVAGAFDASALDRVVGDAAKAGLDVLPVPQMTPSWAAQDPSDGASPPKDPATFAAFLTKLVARYGPKGDFWTEHPELRARPIRQWQIWNEPDITKYWNPSGAWAPAYVKLLKPAYAAVKAADRGAKVVVAGVTNRSWLDLDAIYKAGGRRYFDVAAVHPFSAKVANVLKIVGLTRGVMKKRGDAKKPLALTEISWSSAGKKATSISYGWETTEQGQAARVKEVVAGLAKLRTKDRLTGFYWYTWLSPAIGSKFSFDYGGLRRVSGDTTVSKPALAAFKQAAK